jgi:DNA polymerase III epsilon subunit-like protein
MVQNSPTIKEVLPEFISFLGEDIFVAHNISFDL